MWQNIKRWLENEQIYTSLLIIAVAGLSFTVGMRTNQQNSVMSEPRIHISQSANLSSNVSTMSDQTAAVEMATVPGQNTSVSSVRYEYVASRTGSRFHHITCAGAKQIKEENKIYFATPEAAEAAGYTRALNCQR